MRIVAIAVLALCLAAAAYLGYEHYEDARYVAAITPLIRNASLRIDNAVRMVTVGEGNLTVGEALARFQSDIAEIDKLVLEVQMVPTSAPHSTTAPALAYLRSGQALLRAMASQQRNLVAFASQSAIPDQPAYGSSAVVNEFARRMRAQAVQAAEEQGRNMREAFVAVIVAATELATARSRLEGKVAEDAIFGRAGVEDVAKRADEMLRLTAPRSSGAAADTSPGESAEARAKRESLTEAHNKGWKWAQDKRLASAGGCEAVSDAEERVGCLAYAKAMIK